MGPQTLINDQNLLLWTDDQIADKKHLEPRALKTGNIDNQQNNFEQQISMTQSFTVREVK